MGDQPVKIIRGPAATANAPVPTVTDRATWQARIDELRAAGPVVSGGTVYAADNTAVYAMKA